MIVASRLAVELVCLTFLFAVGLAWHGIIDDCETCTVEQVDKFNNLKFYPRLASLLSTNYFRFYQVSLHQPCPFWPDDFACASKSCQVKSCTPDEVPEGIKEGDKSTKPCAVETTKDVPINEPPYPLGEIDKTLEPQQVEAFRTWREYDETLYDFCEVNDRNDPNNEGEYVDLTLNPERFTGYKGQSTMRIWRAIYGENCFKSERDFFQYANALDHLCLEQRVFYRLISGFHTSITVHLCSKYYNKLSDTAITLSKSAWGPNFDEFRKRFDNKMTNGQGSSRLRNMYLLYLAELRALVKLAPFLEEHSFFTGNKENDEEVRHAIVDLLKVAKSFPSHYDENQLFSLVGNKAQLDNDVIRYRMRDEYRDKFRNISRIMSCVGCDKCKMWGMLQTHGLGTALKILFWPDHMPLPQLKRQEIVALFNAIGRLSTSIRELEVFSHILNADYNNPEPPLKNEL